MNLLTIARKNLARRKGKAAFITAGLAVGAATVVAVAAFVGSMQADINHKLEQYGANILIMPEVKSLGLNYAGIQLGGVSVATREIPQEELALIHTIKNKANIAAVSPLVLGAVAVNGREVLLAGVDFSAVGIIKPWWKADGAFPVGDQALLGSEAARHLSLSQGGGFSLSGREIRVSGVLASTGSQDDNLVFMPLAEAQTILGKEGLVTMAEVAALCGACPVDEMVNQIAEKIPGVKVMAIRQVVQGRMDTLDKIKGLSWGVSGVVAVVGAMVMLVTMMGSVRERTREIGVLRAVGFRKSHVVKVLLAEAVALSVLAGVVGWVVGLAGAQAALVFLVDANHVRVALDPLLAAVSVGLTLVLGMAATAYPAWQAARLDPGMALRAL